MRAVELESDVDALVVLARSSRDPDLAPFVGEVKLGTAVLIVPASGEPSLGYWSPMERDEAAATGLRLLDPESLEVTRASQRSESEPEALAWILGRALLLAGVAPGRVVLAGSYGNGLVVEVGRTLAADGWELGSGHRTVLLARKRKSVEEIAGVRDAAKATVEAFHRVAELLAASHADTSGELVLGGYPLTVARLKGEIAELFGRFGVEQPEGGILAPAEEGAVPHTGGTPERILCQGESIVVDLYPRGRLFADCTRTLCVGEPSPELRAAHSEVVGALRTASDRAHAGVTGWELHEQVCERFSAAGYPTLISDPSTQVGYVHSLGHGVGYQLHELPSFRKGQDASCTLEAGDVITLEPGLYDEARGYGVRVEDLAVVLEDGLDVLTPLPMELEPGAYL